MDSGVPSRRTVVLLSIGFLALGVILLWMGGWVYRVAGVLAIALAVAGLGSLAVRRRPPIADPPSPTPPVIPHSSVPSHPHSLVAPAEPAERVRRLAEPDRRRVETHLADLVAAGVLASDEVDTAWLLERLAQEGEVDADTVLMVLGERQMRRLTFVDSQIEQGPDSVRDQIAELARICGAPVQVQQVEVASAQPREVRIQVQLTVDGEEARLDVTSPAKFLAPDLPIGLARAIRGSGGLRKAGLSSGDGALWIAALPPETDLRLLDRHVLADDGWRGPGDTWFWLDESDETESD